MQILGELLKAAGLHSRDVALKDATDFIGEIFGRVHKVCIGKFRQFTSCLLLEKGLVTFRVLLYYVFIPVDTPALLLQGRDNQCFQADVACFCLVTHVTLPFSNV